jgi:predicted HTH domain antitoxin
MLPVLIVYRVWKWNLEFLWFSGYNVTQDNQRRQSMHKNIDIMIGIPEELVLGSGLPKEKLEFEIKKIYVYDLFRKGKISAGKAAEVLEVTKVRFIDLLKENDIPYFNYSEDEWQEELDKIKNVMQLDI